MNGATSRQFNTLEDLFNYYNQVLFGGQLTECLVNLSRHREAVGFFAHNVWQSERGDTRHEISINPDTLSMGDEFWHQTLVHEMCHLWQFDHGKPSRYSYHNKEWARKMISVGLMPSDTGKPGGKLTGQQMDDYVINGGVFQKAFRNITSAELQNLKLPYKNRIRLWDQNKEGVTGEETDPEGESSGGKKSAGKSGKKSKYTCSCGINVWGKGELSLKCNICQGDFVEQEPFA